MVLLAFRSDCLTFTENLGRFPESLLPELDEPILWEYIRPPLAGRVVDVLAGIDHSLKVEEGDPDAA